MNPLTEMLYKVDDEEVRALYKQFLHTEQGKTLLRDAIKMKKKWRQVGLGSDWSVSTTFLDKNIKKVDKKIRDKMKKVIITPIGLNNQCHANSMFVKQHVDYPSQLGFNVTACPCGGNICFELHTLNVRPDGTYVDYTRDYNDEKEKWFYPLPTQLPYVHFRQVFGTKNEYFQITDKCKCGPILDVCEIVPKTTPEFIQYVDKVDSFCKNASMCFC